MTKTPLLTLTLALALAAALTAADRPSMPTKLTLADAMRIALHDSIALRRADAQIRQAQGQYGQTRSALLPQLTVTANDAVQTTNLAAMGLNFQFIDPRVGPFQSVDARANFSQSVLNLAARRHTQAASELVQAATARAGNARELVAFQVAAAFAQAVRAQSAAATLYEQLQLARQLEATARQRFESGVSSRLEFNRSQQQVNNLTQSLAEARNQLTAAKLDLANLLNAQVTSEYELVPESPAATPAPTPDAALAAAFQSRPDYRAAEAQVRAAQLTVSAAKAERYPRLDFQADYGQSGRKPFENLNTFHIRGALVFPVFNGGRFAAQKTEAEGRLDEARAALDDLHSNIEKDVLAALSALNSAREQVTAASGNVDLARDEVTLSNDRFTAGAADNTEVVNAQDRLSRAQDNLVRARFAVAIARAQLARATGSAETTYNGAPIQ